MHVTTQMNFKGDSLSESADLKGYCLHDSTYITFVK